MGPKSRAMLKAIFLFGGFLFLTSASSFGQDFPSRPINVVVTIGLGSPKFELPRTPSDYYKARVYPDSVSTYLPAIRCCLEYVGSNHMLLGTDYANRMGTWDRAVGLVKEFGLSEVDTNLILGDNAARLFQIE